MGDSSGSLDYWRKFFRSANSDIFELIEKAILVAAVDCSKEFKERRDQIAEKLFASQFSRCFGCNLVELQVPYSDENAREEEEGRSVKRVLGVKDCKVDSLIRAGVSNYSYDEAEALVEVIEEENYIVGEVLRIKEVLCNKQEESDAVLLESLRNLQLMQLSVETLKATEIGRSVNGLRKHNSKLIRSLVRTLIDGWKVLVDEWVKATAAIPDHSPESVNPSVVDEEEGLPSPPMDEGALLATHTTSMELSKFFDGMDEVGNFSPSGDFNKIRDAGRVTPESHSPVRRQQPLRQLAIPEEKSEMRKQEAPVLPKIPHSVPGMESKPQSTVNKMSKPSTADFGPGRPSKLASEQKPISQFSVDQRNPSNTPHDRSKQFDEASEMARLEIAKRKLQEGYRRAENAKKQRRIQIMELHDLPKQSFNQRPSNAKPRNQSRNLANSW